jgi:hypothetical protein
MPHILHLVNSTASSHALSVLQRQHRNPDTTLTVVLVQGAATPPLPAEVRVLRLAGDSPAPDALTYAELLDLIFSADQIISW